MQGARSFEGMRTGTKDFLAKVLGVREALQDVVFLGLVERSPSSQLSFDISRHPFVDVALAGLATQNFAGTGYFEPAGSRLVGLHLRHCQ